MKLPLLLALLSFGVLMTSVGQAEDQGEAKTIWTGMTEVEGTVLWRSDISTSSKASGEAARNCTIGFITTDGEKGAFVPVLTLPEIKDDSYETKVVDGALKITIKKTGRLVLILNLRNLLPIALTE